MNKSLSQKKTLKFSLCQSDSQFKSLTQNLKKKKTDNGPSLSAAINGIIKIITRHSELQFHIT